LRVETIGADPIVTALRTFAEAGELALDYELIATDMAARSIVRLTYAGTGRGGGGEWEATRLVVTDIADGAFTTIVLFDEDDVLGALEEMSPAGAAIVGFVRRYNVRDWDGFRGLFSSDVDIRDRRAFGWGNFTGAEQMLTRLLERVELAPDIAISIDACPIVTERAGLFRLPMTGHLADGGGEFEGNVLCLIELDGDVIVRMQIFEPDDLERVASRFGELASGSA
jgi:hypothetical protein